MSLISLKNNKISLIINKTHFILTHSQTRNHHPIDNKINGSSIKQVEEAKFFGIIIDYKLQWKFHKEKINNKSSKITGIMY